MPEQDEELAARVERLEAALEQMRGEIAALRQADVQGQVAKKAVAPPPVSAPPPMHETSGAATWTAAKRGDQAKRWVPEWSSEDWLSKIGIALLLFGVAFLFKYSVDAGWLTPAVRVLFGAALGAVLLVFGLRARRQEERQRLGQILLGGSIAAFYGTVFAAYQLYGLVPHAVAFGCMVAVTALAFGLAIRHGDAALSVVGALGGLATPFLLYTDAGSLPGLIGYTSLVLLGAAAVYLYRGWRSLLSVAYAGGWLVLWLGVIEAFSMGVLPAGADRLALRLGVLFTWLLFATVPIARRLRERSGAALQTSEVPGEDPPQTSVFARYPAFFVTFGAPLIALAFAYDLWQLPSWGWGSVALGGAVLYGLAWVGLRRQDADTLALAHLLTAGLLLTYSLTEFFEGNTLLVALAAEAAAFHLLARRESSRMGWAAAHGLSLAVGLWIAGRLTDSAALRPVLVNAQALSEGIALALGVAVALKVLRGREQQIYLFALHALFLGWLLRELHSLPGGQAYATAAWGVYAVALLVVGVRQNLPLLRNTALGTVLLVVGKLFLVDLDRLEAIWRILLFLGLGGLFLLLSYYLPKLWRAETEADEVARPDV
ncbi:MAG: DUF2339 domain-containing protein [Rhodothermales bacterium]